MNLSELYIRAGARRLPVDVQELARAAGVKVVDYKTAAEYFGVEPAELYEKSRLGFCFKADGELCAALNENSCGERRRRFTAAHELAHCLLGQVQRTLTAAEEREAERLAADLLAPPAVLHKLGITSAEKLSRLCGISESAAAVQLERVALREKSGFELSKDEERLVEIFGEFIEKHCYRKKR